MIDALLAKFYKAIIIVLMAFLLVLSLAVGVQTWRIGSYQVDQANSDKVRAEAVERAVRPYIDAAKAKQDELNKASEDYEKLRSEQQIRTEVVTREVQKIIDRPMYLNECFDADGLSAINRFITDNTS